MDWNALQDYECPKCGEPLEEIGAMHECTNADCDFRIRNERLEEIVSEMQDRDEDDRWGGY